MQFCKKTTYVWGLRFRWDPSLSRTRSPVPAFYATLVKCDICHLSRTYGRAISVTRLAGAPIKMTIARFAMKNSLFCTISSGWQPEKLRLGEEVVHSKAWSDSKFSWPLELNILMVILQIEKLQQPPRILFDKDWQSAEQKCPTVAMVAFPGCATAEPTENLFHPVYILLEACESCSNWCVEIIIFTTKLQNIHLFLTLDIKVSPNSTEN